MGCDIHGWVEIRPYEWNKDYWKSMINISYLERNYLIFARIFGVRNHFEDLEITPIAANRGLPSTDKYDDDENNNEPRNLDRKECGVDGHSESWISLKEFYLHLDEIFEPYNVYATFSKWWALYQMMRILGDLYGLDNVRLVVWFDN